MNPLKFMESRLGRFSKKYRNLVLRTYVVTLRLVLTVAFPNMVAGIFYAILGKREKQYKAFLKGSKTWGRAVIKMTKTELIIKNEIQVPETGHLIFLNHVNEIDFPYDCLVVNRPYLANQVIKKTLIAYWWMKAMGSQVFETSKATTIAVSVRNVIKGLSTNSYIVYPEGHNSYSEIIQPMQKGMIKLAFENKIPVVVILKSGITRYQTEPMHTKVGYKFIGRYEPWTYGTWEAFRDFLYKTMSQAKIDLDAEIGTVRETTTVGPK
ncbi:1-acyl-sn-glycerol-3-phosphate acyltransferase [Leptospira semungkisensis]|uniref:1-acyl-sn-glycerol-3-phosphate acyltransferase n=1 Tax=Leptospira semungkisensis TaxID=2484985 RepID=A0A4V6QKF3_9LEPT|nr:1-acyl-sn-glycerol-3-phosphate acyltransferase [Leptospira semungkisensis]TGJ99668.1 1-acyl-sn-glycerol-3-phosphate acyltransferase [Leptospira semungkisensis]